MSRFAFIVAGAVLSLVAAAPAAAQQPATPKPEKPDTTVSVRSATEAAADSAAKELGRAVAVLAASVQKIVTETANDPEVRLAAVQAAGQAVSVAQTTLAENMNEIERMLREASRALAEAEAAQRAKTARKTP